jgi:hypothetical protein
MYLKYSQTWVNNYLWITTTCLQRPHFWGPKFNFHNKKLPLNNDHLSTTATNFGCQMWSLYTSLAVLSLNLLLLLAMFSFLNHRGFLLSDLYPFRIFRWKDDVLSSKTECRVRFISISIYYNDVVSDESFLGHFHNC